jgi:hypothetical protein
MQKEIERFEARTQAFCDSTRIVPINRYSLLITHYSSLLLSFKAPDPSFKISNPY